MFTRKRQSTTNIAASSSARPSLPLLRAARSAASGHSEWVLQAVQELRDQVAAERTGVWLEDSRNAQESYDGPIVFHGQVWERGIGSGPPEWARLSGDAALPKELLQEHKTCEYDLPGPHSGYTLGPLVGLARVQWVPITAQGMLRGILMLGSRFRQQPLPRAFPEKIAQELGLLLELEESQRVAGARKADLELQRRVRTLLRGGHEIDTVLAELLRSCTCGTAAGGVGAVFALLGEHAADGVSGFAAEESPLHVRAEDGDNDWVRRVVDGPLESIWRHAFVQKRIIGADAEGPSAGEEKLRVVAIPLSHGDENFGVLLAGLPLSRANLENLERLEMRAALAAEALAQQRRAESTQERERWYQALLESSEQPFVLVDTRGMVGAMSRGARELLRETRNEIGSFREAPRLAEFFRPRQRDRLQHWLETRTESPREEMAFESELANGVAVTLSRARLSASGFAVVAIEKHQAAPHARKVEDVEEELRQAIEWLEEGVVLFAENGDILARNSRFFQILGLSEKQGRTLRNLEEVIGAASGNFASPELFAAEWRALQENAAGGTQHELPMEKPMPQVIERCTRTITAANGRMLGRVEVYREDTARRMFQSRMLQAEKLATLGQRATAIMHELSNPLTSILGNAQRMILRGPEGTQLAEAHRILEEAERASAILRQLLLISRETRPERRTISLNELVRHAVDLQRAALSGSSIRLQVDTAAGLPRIIGDAGQLQQVLLNLLQNAQQAIEHSGRGSLIGVRTSSSAPDRVRLEVWDDGPGIPEALQARIFDPFFTTKPEGVGTGLGLAIVNGFVRQHGGSIAVFCPPEGGSRFIIELPAEAAHLASRYALEEARSPLIANVAGGPLPQESGAFCSAGATRVLVVEDEHTVAELIADVLRDEGMQVDVLLDGRKALEAARHSRYDLAICDLKMPEVDGQLFFSTLQQEQNPLRERVLFVTGDVVAPRTHEFLERNRLPHLAKPFRVEELSEAVHRVLWGGARAAAAGTDRTEAIGNGMGP